MKEVQSIASRLKGMGIEVLENEIESRMRLLTEKFHVPPPEAQRSVFNYFLKEHGLSPPKAGASAPLKISEIKETGRWADLDVKVLSISEPVSPSISQSGFLGDETGTIRFVKWAKADLPDLAPGKSYHLKNVVTDEYQGRFSVKLNRTSEVIPLDKDIEAVDSMAQQELKVEEIDRPGRWLDLQAKVIQLWEAKSDSISQTGLLGDETGIIKFVKWTKTELPDLVEGTSYLLKSVVTDEYGGRFSIKLNNSTQIIPLDKDIEVPSAIEQQELKIGEIDQPGRWLDLRAKVVQLWEAKSDSISQSGLLGDETGIIKFVKWAKAGLPDLVEGKSYLLKSVVSDEYGGRFSIKLNQTSTFQEIDEPVEVTAQSATFYGAIVDIQKGSGLIKRCPVCKRSLAKGICVDHGKQEGIYDLRIKAAIDDGDHVQDLLINRERTEGLVGLTLEQAREKAMEVLDHEIIMNLMEEKLIGRYFRASGQRFDRYLLVESIEEIPPVSNSEIEALISDAEAI